VSQFGTDPERLLAMPVRLFWSMAKAVDRIRAGEELALYDAFSIAQAEGEIRNEYREALRERLGTVTRREKPRSSSDDILAALVPLEG